MTRCTFENLRSSIWGGPPFDWTSDRMVDEIMYMLQSNAVWTTKDEKKALVEKVRRLQDKDWQAQDRQIAEITVQFKALELPSQETATENAHMKTSMLTELNNILDTAAEHKRNTGVGLTSEETLHVSQRVFALGPRGRQRGQRGRKRRPPGELPQAKRRKKDDTEKTTTTKRKKTTTSQRKRAKVS